MATASARSLDAHFTGRDPVVRATYDAVVDAAKRLGPVRAEPKKTSIHLVRTSAFAGVAARRSWLVLTLKADADVESPRITKRERTSSRRWHLEVRLESPRQVDRQLRTWLAHAYELSA